MKRCFGLHSFQFFKKLFVMRLWLRLRLELKIGVSSNILYSTLVFILIKMVYRCFQLLFKLYYSLYQVICNGATKVGLLDLSKTFVYSNYYVVLLSKKYRWAILLRAGIYFIKPYIFFDFYSAYALTQFKIVLKNVTT